MNNLSYRLIVILPLLLLLPLGNVRAAGNESYHEVTGGGNIFWSSPAPLLGGDARSETGFGGGAGYIYHFNSRFNLRTGLEVNHYKGTSRIGEVKEQSTVGISEEWFWTGDKSFEFRSYFSGYLAEHSVLYLQTPLLFGYEAALPWMEGMSWYVNGGFKLGYSLRGNSNALIDSINTEGFFDYQDYSMDDIKNLLGFGSYRNERRQAVLNLGFSATGYVEAGLKQTLAQRYNFYFGIFGEYSLYSAIRGATHPRMYEYEAQHTPDKKYYELRYTPASHVSGISSKTFYPMAFGVAIRFGFGIKRGKVVNNRMIQMHHEGF
ncbi:MAG: outer membrane beta-barrel protein [Prevotellaceae bacterium]|jgi:hypothetical protein|nr:outer membrane beta-barrel protein [Prevotellaceae bacterium]